MALDSAGKPTSIAAEAGALLPFGGFGKSVRSMFAEPHRSGDNGHFMLALDIARFVPLEVFQERLEILLAGIEASGETGRVRIPGALRWRLREENAKQGILLDAAATEALLEVCPTLELELPALQPD